MWVREERGFTFTELADHSDCREEEERSGDWWGEVDSLLNFLTLKWVGGRIRHFDFEVQGGCTHICC